MEEEQQVNEFHHQAEEIQPVPIRSEMIIEEMKPTSAKRTRLEVQNLESAETKDATGSMESIEAVEATELEKSLEIIGVTEGVESVELAEATAGTESIKSMEIIEGKQEIEPVESKEGCVAAEEEEGDFDQRNSQDELEEFRQREMDIFQPGYLENIEREVTTGKVLPEFQERLIDPCVLRIATNADFEHYVEDLNKYLTEIREICSEQQDDILLQISLYLEAFINLFKNWQGEEIETQLKALKDSLIMVKVIVEANFGFETKLVNFMEEAYDWRLRNFDFCLIRTA